MPFTIPSSDLASVPDRQSVWYDTDIAILVAGVAGTGVLTGCEVTAQVSPDMTLAVASGAIQPIAGAPSVAVTGANVVIGAADASPRIDLLSVSPAGVLTVTAGIADASPKPPDLPAGDVALAMVDVPDTATAIETAQVTDKRVFVRAGAVLVDPGVEWEANHAYVLGERIRLAGPSDVFPGSDRVAVFEAIYSGDSSSSTPFDYTLSADGIVHDWGINWLFLGFVGQFDHRLVGTDLHAPASDADGLGVRISASDGEDAEGGAIRLCGGDASHGSDGGWFSFDGGDAWGVEAESGGGFWVDGGWGEDAASGGGIGLYAGGQDSDYWAAAIDIEGAHENAHGVVHVATDGSNGAYGQALMSDGDESVVWANPLAKSPMAAAGDLIVGGAGGADVNDTSPTGNVLVVTGTAETIMNGCDLEVPLGAKVVSIYLDVWASLAFSAGAGYRYLTFNLRRTDATGAVLASSGYIWVPATQGTAGHTSHWEVALEDDTPTDGKYVVTVFVSSYGEASDEIYSDTRTFELTSSAGGMVALPVGDPGQALIAQDDGTEAWMALAVRSGAGVPTGAPATGELPIAIDTTGGTGGIYVWTGSWVKAASI